MTFLKKNFSLPLVFLAFVLVGVLVYWGINYNGAEAKFAREYNQAPEIKNSYQLDRLALTQWAENEDAIEIIVGDPNSGTFIPEMTVSRWDGEASFKMKYTDASIQTAKNPSAPEVNFDNNKIIYSDGTSDVHFYEKPVSAEHPEGAYEVEFILKAKPASNIVSLDIETENLDFFYQPPFNQIQHGPRIANCTETECFNQNGAVVSSKAENTVGSYAVYYKENKRGDHSRMGGKNYQTGKAFHIYRPQIIDAEGNKIWGELKIDTDKNELAIIIPPDFLEKAVYPVTVDPTFGYTSIGVNKNYGSGWPSATEPVVSELGTAPVGGTLNYINWAMSGESSFTMKTAVYNDSGGYPNTRLGLDTNTMTIGTTDPPTEFVQSSDDYNLAITGGAVYWAAAGNLSGNGNVYSDTVSNYENYYDSGVATPPATWTNFSYWPITGQRYSVYATYTGSKTQINSPLSGRLTNSLVGYWSFDGADTNWTSATAGTTDDVSVNSNIGTLTNMSRSASPIAGINGQAFKFNGTDNRVELSSNIFGSASDRTLCAWMNTASVTTWQAIAGNDAFIFGPYSTNSRLILTNDGGSTWIVSSDNSITTNQWYHACAVRLANNTGSIYINGSQSGSSGNVGGPGFPTTSSIGSQRAGSNGLSFNGLLDDVRVYDRALSQAEITEQYRSGAARLQTNTQITGGLSSGLIGHWTMNGVDTTWTSATAGTTADISGNNNTGTLTNMSRSASPVPGKIGQALNFDGSDDYINLSSTYGGRSYNDVTISAWFKSAATTLIDDGEIFIHIENPLSDGISFSITDDASYVNRLRFKDYIGGSVNYYGTSDIMDMKWHHLAAVRTATRIKLYVDGLLETDDPDSFAGQTIIATTSPGVYIGDDLGNTEQVNGSLDDVRVYNRALTATEVGQLYNLGTRKMQFQP